MNTADILGWVGNVGFFAGAILLAQKKVSGFWWQIEGNAFYLVQAWILGMTSLVVCSAILIAINIAGIVNWTLGGGNAMNIFFLLRARFECFVRGYHVLPHGWSSCKHCSAGWKKGMNYKQI